MTLVGGDGSSYSDRYRFLDQQKLNERTQRTAVSRERAKLLSQATNKRRRAIEEKRSKEERQEEERREAILAQRREWQNQATIRFQRAHLPPEKRNFKFNRVRPRTPPRSISVEDALRTIQTQKFERSSSFHRQHSKSPDGFQGGSFFGSKDENNNASNSPYAQPQYIPGFHHHFSRSNSGFAFRSAHNSSFTHEKQNDEDETSERVARNNSERANQSGTYPNSTGVVRSHSAGQATSLARDKLRIVTETYNIQPYQQSQKKNRPDSASPSSTTTTIIQLDTPSKTQSASSLHHKLIQQQQPKTPNGHLETEQREKIGRETYQMNSIGPKGKPPVAPTRSHFGGGDSAATASSHANTHASKNAFEKQIEIQQKKLVEMQQKTVEDFQRALNQTAALVPDHVKTTHTSENEPEKISKDSLDGDSDSSDNELEKQHQKNKKSASRPMNPEPLDDATRPEGASVTEKGPSHKSPTPNSGLKFRTPQSTETISAEQAKSIISPQIPNTSDSNEKNSTSEWKNEADKEGNGSSKSVVIQRPTTAQIKRKPLPVNSANTVAKAIETKTNWDEDDQIGFNSPSPQNAGQNFTSVNGDHLNGGSRSLKQEPGPTTSSSGSSIAAAKTPLQYIAYTPIRKWDSPGSTSPKPVAQVAPVPSTPPEKSAPKDTADRTKYMQNELSVKTEVVQPNNSDVQNGVSQNLNSKDLKHSAKMYMNGLQQSFGPQTVPTVAHVIDPQWSIYNNSQKSVSSTESSSASNVDKVYDAKPKQDLSSHLMNGGGNFSSESIATQESSVNLNFQHEDQDFNNQQPQKSLIPVPISREKDMGSRNENDESSRDQIARKPEKLHQTETSKSSSTAKQTQKSSVVRQDSDGSTGSHRSRPEIRSSSPFDRLLDGSNADEIEELDAMDEFLPQPKSILKRSLSLENCQIKVKDSLDIQSTKRLAKTPTPTVEKPGSAKRSVRFAETVQVQCKDEIDEQMPRSHARAMSARAGVRIAESPDRSRRATPKSAPLKPPASQNVPSEIENIRNSQMQPNKQQNGNDSDNEYSLNKTPTDEEINALWESIRENMSANKRSPIPTYDGASNHKPPVYISNSNSGYYNNFIKPTNSPPAVASQYIDGSFLFEEQNRPGQIGQISRPTSAASIPRKQHLLGQRQQQNTVRPISSANAGASSSRGGGSIPSQNSPSPTVGNHAPFPGVVPKSSSSAATFSSSSASHKTQQNKQQPPDTVTNSLAQFVAAEDLSNMSLSEGQIEDILRQLQSRRNVTQLSLEEQKLMMSLEHLNNKLKLTEARLKGP